MDQHMQTCFEIALSGDHGLNLCHEPGVKGCQHAVEKVALVLEIAVDQTLGYVCRVGDLCDRGSLEAVFDERTLRDVENGIVAVLQFLGADLRHRRPMES